MRKTGETRLGFRPRFAVACRAVKSRKYGVTPYESPMDGNNSIFNLRKRPLEFINFRWVFSFRW